ncbi:MAG: PDZ domain-containing protein [Planctomycetota bacterium]
MRTRIILVSVVLGCLLIALLAYRYARRTRPSPTSTPSSPSNNLPSNMAGQLRLSDDAANKVGDFWLEQTLQLSAEAIAQPNALLLDLYLSVDPKTLSGTWARLRNGEIALETGSVPTIDRPDPATITLAKAEFPALTTGQQTLGALWRRGELSMWLGSRQILTVPAAKKVGELKLKGASGVVAHANGLRLGVRRTMPLNAIRFTDTFMRDTADGAWCPAAGHWELTALAFPERSANPFSLRVSFKNEKSEDDKLYQGRLRHEDYGLGIHTSSNEGTLNIERITGGSPAARAGLAEQDIFLEVNGVNVGHRINSQIHQLLTSGENDEVRLRILRPGEKKPRNFKIPKQMYRWGTPSEGVALSPLLPLLETGNKQAALIATGETGWSDYIAEVAVKPMGTGGMGLVVGMLSPQDYLVFRWRGPRGRGDEIDAVYDKLELARVVAGKETLLAEKFGGYRPYEFYRMSVDWNGDQIVCLLDDNEIFKANAPGLKRGQVGLYALKGDPVFFDDVCVVSERHALIASRRPELTINQIMAYEENMEVWANPALEWKRDLKTGWATHRARFPGEQTVVLNHPKFKTLNILTRCNGDSTSPQSGALFSIANGEARFQGESLSSRPLKLASQSPGRVVVRDTGRQLEADIDSQHLVATRAIASATGSLREDRIAIRGLQNISDSNLVRVSSSNTLEYTFNTSPSDWKVSSGRWGLLNKWICDPRWSWFGGRTTTLAAIWNKLIFSGDISVDGYVALLMQKDQNHLPHERSGDYNFVICGDGVNLDSGYTLIFGGDNNSWTRLYRQGKLVAESNREEHRVFSDRIRHPDKPELHQRWFHLKLEKIGNQVSFYRDDVLAFTFIDPNPLPEGRVGFWTLDNGFLLARVRIAHSGARPAPFEVRRSALYEDARVINTYDGEVLTSVTGQRLPPTIRASLNARADAFQPTDADALSAAEWEARDKMPDAYRVVNGVGGGPFALQWRKLTVDPNKSVIRFAYRLEPSANVDLYLVNVSPSRNNFDGFNPRQSGAYRWRLTGPRESNELAPLVGDVPEVKADGRWHTMQFDLQPSWQAFWKKRGCNQDTNSVLRMMIGNLDNTEYLLAGMNGNHAGVAYSISDIIVLTPKEVDTQSPEIERVIWPFDADGDGQSIFVVFRDRGGSGILRESLDVAVNKTSVPNDLLEFDPLPDHPISATTSVTQTSRLPLIQHLKINLCKLNMPSWQDGQTLNLKVLGFQDRAGNPSNGSFMTTYTYSAAKALSAAKPVAAPKIITHVGDTQDIVPSGGALTLNDISYWDRNATRLQESADAPPWASGGQKRSLQVVNVSDGSFFGFTFKKLSFDLRRWPYLLIDYKIPFETPMNLHFMDQSGSMHALLLTDVEDARDMDSNNIISRCGPPADFVADGVWRQTMVPLQRLLETVVPRGQTMDIQCMSLHDNGWQGNRRGMEYWIHRIQPLPAGRTDVFKFTWLADAITGINDYASCLDGQPQTDPMSKQEIASGENLLSALNRRGVALQDGWNYLHVRVRNGAGVWSDVAHARFFLDNQPPKILRVEPAASAVTTGQTLRIYVGDASSIAPQTLNMMVNGKTLNGLANGITFDYATGVFTYNALVAGTPWPDGSEVAVDIRNVSDTFGNRLQTPCRFNFKVNRSSDRVGPLIARMCFVSASQSSGQPRTMAMETSFGLNFEEHTGHVHAIRDCRMDWLNDPAQAAFGSRAAKFTVLDDATNVQIMLHKNPWYFDRLPVLQFDYKADPGFRVDLLAEVMGEWHSIRFTGDGVAPEGGQAIGVIEDVVADGKWHHASVDLATLIKAAKPNLEARIINKIILSAQGRDGCQRGATLVLDNLDITPPFGSGGSFEWEAAPDPSGLAGYAFLMDQNPTTAPISKITHTEASAAVDNVSGVWYAHVRACDQAGNWGPTRHFRIDFGDAKQEHKRLRRNF